MYCELDELVQTVARRTTKGARSQRPDASRMVALHLDFVARPNGSPELASELALAMEEARLRPVGLEASILLVSDREARLVTLLTFWDARRFLPVRESRIAWMQKLLAPFAEGSIRAHTSLPQFLAEEPRGGAAANPLGLPHRAVQQAAAG